MIRVAFVHNYFPAGGAERVTIDISRYLNSTGGYEVYVYASRIMDSLLTDDVASSFTLRRIPTQAIPSKRAKQIEKYIVEDKIDILVQVIKAIPGIEEIRSRTGVKTVVACHGEPFWQRHAIIHRRQKGLFRKLMWLLFNKRRYADGSLAMHMAVGRTLKDYNSSDAYTVLCESYKQEMSDALGISANKSHIYPIENSESAVADVNYNKENIILFCGRFENWSKRIDRLLLIWKNVQSRMSDWRLVLVGDGADFYKISQLADRMSLERVFFEGRKSNVSEYYRKSSIVALTSETEGWPLALTEAQAHGCICVAFGCTSGVKDVLSPNEECGFIVPAFDEQKYVDALLKIAAMSEEERLRIRKKSVAKRLGYVPEIISDKWKLLFDYLYKEKNNV